MIKNLLVMFIYIVVGVSIFALSIVFFKTEIGIDFQSFILNLFGEYRIIIVLLITVPITMLTLFISRLILKILKIK